MFLGWFSKQQLAKCLIRAVHVSAVIFLEMTGRMSFSSKKVRVEINAGKELSVYS
jgi:hypothetical protein